MQLKKNHHRFSFYLCILHLRNVKRNRFSFFSSFGTVQASCTLRRVLWGPRERAPSAQLCIKNIQCVRMRMYYALCMCTHKYNLIFKFIMRK